MKVKIGPYLNWWGPYQIVDLFFGIRHRSYGINEPDTWRYRWSHRIGKFLAEHTKLEELCSWIHSKRRRRIKVQLDPYDTWSMDETLRFIIAPMLVQLKATKHGSGCVDDCDVPEHLRSTAPGARDGCEEWDSDHNLHKRYDWLLDELIWVFNTDHELAKEEFYDHGDVNPAASFVTQINQIKVDREKLDAYNARVTNAYRLFGKYFQTLWD